MAMSILKARITPLVVGLVVLTAACVVVTVPADAAGRGAGGGHGHFGGHGFPAPHAFHGGFGASHRFPVGPGRFHRVEPNIWRGGHWHHGIHAGRFGWWWVVGDGWYYYPEAIDPYPQYWYFCPSVGAYYPYVSACPEGWTPVIP